MPTHRGSFRTMIRLRRSRPSMARDTSFMADSETSSMRSWTSSRVIGLVSAALLSAAAQADPRPFSLYGLAGWEEKTFLRHAHTGYRAVADGRIQVIEAQCDSSASGLTWHDRIDLSATP